MVRSNYGARVWDTSLVYIGLPEDRWPNDCQNLKHFVLHTTATFYKRRPSERSVTFKVQDDIGDEYECTEMLSWLSKW